MKKIYLSLALILLIVLVAGFGVWQFSHQVHAQGKNDSSFLVQIKKGETTAELLQDIESHEAFNSRLLSIVFKFKGVTLKTGFYEIPAHASIADVVGLISSGKIKLVKITFPEGWRVEQIAERLSSNGIVDYATFLAAAKPKEGKLFPDTYLFNPKESADEVVRMMEDDYASRTEGLTVANATLVLASIVEREAASNADRPIIAAVYSNRLKKGMKLEADPTVQYGKDSNAIADLSLARQTQYKFWSPITLADYKSVDSEYNTYLIDGLPATPICNPGLASIQAALTPDNDDYLYFLHANGQIYPSKTLTEHNQKRVSILGVKAN